MPDGREQAARVEAEPLKPYLDRLVARYERPAFIAEDPIAFPHAFEDPRDQEVIGLFAALLAWGRRSTILDKLHDLVERMEYRPYAFVRDYDPGSDALASFRHRTFQPSDADRLVRALQAVLVRYGSLEALFASFLDGSEDDTGRAIQGFSDALLAAVPDTPVRMRKHLPRPSTGSACKRLALYVRWMVRPGPVDLGIWSTVSPARLLVPLDVHTGRQARKLGLLRRPRDDWKATLELTERCRQLCAEDPARYDFALFGLGAYEGRAIEGAPV